MFETTVSSYGSAPVNAGKTALNLEETPANSNGQSIMEKKRKDVLETNLIIFGPPGAGKGTYASKLAAEFQIANIATGDIFRNEIKEKTNLGRKIARFVEKGLLVPDEMVIEVLKKRISQPNSQHGFILDGYPRTIEQAKALDTIAKVDAVIHLIVPEQVIIERLSTRRICKKCGAIYNVKYLRPKIEGVCDKCGGKLIQREDDKPEVIKERLRIYEKQTQPLIEYYQGKLPILNVECNSVDAPPEKIVKQILRKLQRANLMQK
jgi:adenylate kinase